MNSNLSKYNPINLAQKPMLRGEVGCACVASISFFHTHFPDIGCGKLELELIQSHMAQRPVLRGEVGCVCVAREVSVERGGMGERGCARRLVFTPGRGERIGTSMSGINFSGEV